MESCGKGGNVGRAHFGYQPQDFFTAAGDACSPFYNENMFVFYLMDVHRRGIAGARGNFNE
jgi:hypothetical protein